MHQWKEKLINEFQISEEILNALEVYFELNDFERMYEALDSINIRERAVRNDWPMAVFLPFSSKLVKEYQHFFYDTSQTSGKYSLKDIKGFALHNAVLANNTNAMKFLLMSAYYGLTSEEKYIMDSLLLCYAASYGRVEVMQLLMAMPYNIDPRRTYDPVVGCSALHYAALNGHVAVMQLLMAKPYCLDPRTYNHAGCSALHCLALSGKADSFSFFLRHYPVESKACWFKNKNGENPHDIGRHKKMQPSPLQLLHQHLIEVTQSIATGNTQDENAYLLLDSFSEEWENCLFNTGVEINRTGLRSNLHLLSAYPKLTKTVASIKAILDLLAYDMLDDQPLTYNTFACLLAHVGQESSSRERKNFFLSFFYTEKKS